MGFYGNKITDVKENTIDDIKKKITVVNQLKSQWKKSASTFVKHKWIYRYLDVKQKEKISKYYEMLKTDEISYSDYKRYFKAIAKFMGLPDDKIIIENIVFKKDSKDKEQDIIALKYSKGMVKVMIPDDVRLIHVSPVDNITELIPSFRSKVAGKYLYPSKRCFFTVTKEIKPTQAGLEKQKTIRYTPKEKIKEAYIDPTYSDFKSGSVYIETLKPIPVEKFQTTMERIFGKIGGK